MQPDFWINFYTPPDPALWQGRSDALPGEQLYQQIQCVNLLIDSDSLLQKKEPIKKTFAFVGFCCDEGVRRNGGRTPFAKH